MTSFSAPRDPFRRPFGGGGRRPRALVPTLVILAILLGLAALGTNFLTDWLWFDAIGYRSVFTTTLLTKIGLFVVFAVVMAAVIFLNIAVAYRARPRYRATSAEQQSLDRYRDMIEPHHKLIGIVVAVIVGLFAGSSAAGQWRTYLQWVNSESFGRRDPQFGMDISFFTFEFPWYRYLISFGFGLIALAIIAAVVTHYIFGAIRLQTPGQKVSSTAQVHISVLLGLFVLLKAVAYWFDRFELLLGQHQLTAQGFTGMTYSDANALLPAKTILMVIAAVCALLFFGNIVRRTWLLPGLGVGLLALSAVLLGWAWPAVIQQVQVRPNEPDREREYIEKNIEATRHAFNVDDSEVIPYDAATEVEEGQLAGDADTIPGIRLVDPNLVGPTFDQLQQVRGYYSFPETLDVDRYRLDGPDAQPTDAVVAVREISLAGVPAEQRNWANDHTVFTHGYGFVAAYGNRRGGEGEPDWLEENIPPQGALTDRDDGYEPRIYYGEESPPYSIVGRPEGAGPVELDIPEGVGSEGERKYTYEGKGGVPIGSFWRKALYAAKFRDFNIILSGRVTEASKILYDRSPAERVQKVAPWLSIDSDPHPAVVDGRIVWIVDAYTISDAYPYSQHISIEDAINDSLTQDPTLVGAPSTQANYVRNSVKATVDAYDGTVELYAWDENDPILRTWMNAFPGTVKPKSQMSDALLDQVRYPVDLFKMQREILAQYHVTNPATFYAGSERWRLPTDPNSPQNKQPPYYLSVRMPEQDKPTFSLTTTYIYYNRENLAAFAAVDADARSETYGKIRALEISNKAQIDGPLQIANKIESDNTVAEATLPFTRGDNTIRRGNLLTLPVGGGLLYVQPVYVERQQASAYPLLRLVVVSFAGEIGVGTTLQEALDKVFEGESGADTGEEVPSEGEEGEEPPPDGEGEGEGQPPDLSNLPAEVRNAIADAIQASEDVDTALNNKDLGAYADAVARLQEAIRRLEEAGIDVPAGDAGGNSGGGSGANAGGSGG